jgi:CheY-like chemotaxis protein
MSDDGRPRPIEILLIEDDPGDVLLTREAFESSRVSNVVRVISDGAEAVEHLRSCAGTSAAPDLILLDLNLPKVSGPEILEFAKADPDLRRIPVVVLTTSAAEEDIVRTYDRYANAYITKPVDVARFLDVVRQVDDFYLTIVQLPPHTGEVSPPV